MLGADCPFFIDKTASYAEGIGDKLSHLQIDLSPYHLLIICPEVHISTEEAFNNIIAKPSEEDLINLINTYPIAQWKEHVFNDFEEYAFHMHPELEEIKSKLYEMGALYASMSGTGSSIYGFFKEEVEIELGLKQFVSYWEKF